MCCRSFIPILDGRQDLMTSLKHECNICGRESKCEGCVCSKKGYCYLFDFRTGIIKSRTINNELGDPYFNCNSCKLNFVIEMNMCCYNIIPPELTDLLLKNVIVIVSCDGSDTSIDDSSEESTDESSNESADESSNESSNESSESSESSNESADESSNESADESADESIDESADESIAD